MPKSNQIIIIVNDSERVLPYKILAEEIAISDHQLLARLYTASKPNKPTEELINSYISSSVQFKGLFT